MKKRNWIVLVAMVAAVVGVGQAFAQDEGEEKQGAGANTDWRAPTKHHAEMAKSVGEFDVLVEMFFAPGAPAQKAPATATRELIMNGLYVQETFSMAMPDGKFEGRSVMGYDTVRKRWVSTWIDNQNPVYSVTYGQEKDGVLTFTGEDPDMMSGKLTKSKSTVKHGDDNSMVVTMFKIGEKGEQMTMRLTYTPKKK